MLLSKRKILSFITSTLLVLLAAPVLALSTANTPLVTDLNYHYSPDIYGNNITYMDKVNGQDLGYVYNLRTKQTTQLPLGATNPRIYNKYVAYISSQSSNPEVYLYNLKIGTSEQITTDTNYKQEADIWGENIVWAESVPNFNNNIYMYNIKTQKTTQITFSNSTDEYNPSVGRNWVSWTSGVGISASIYVYNLATSQMRLTVSEPGADHSRTYGDTIAWDDQRRGTSYSDVYVMDLNKHVEKLVSDGIGVDGGQSIYKQNIAYTNFSSNQGDIEVYNIKTGKTTQITNDPATQSQPSIYGSKIVWIDYRNGLPEVYGNIK